MSFERRPAEGAIVDFFPHFSLLRDGASLFLSEIGLFADPLDDSCCVYTYTLTHTHRLAVSINIGNPNENWALPLTPRPSFLLNFLHNFHLLNISTNRLKS